MDKVIFVENSKFSAHPVHGVIFKKGDFYIGILPYKDRKKGYISLSEESEERMKSFFKEGVYLKISASEVDLEIIYKRLCFERLFGE